MLLAFERFTLQLLVITQFCLGLMRTVSTTVDVFSDIISDIPRNLQLKSVGLKVMFHIKNNFYPVTAHEGLEWEYRYGSTLSSA